MFLQRFLVPGMVFSRKGSAELLLDAEKHLSKAIPFLSDFPELQKRAEELAASIIDKFTEEKKKKYKT